MLLASAYPMRLHRYSFEDYLRVEEMSTVGHEFLDGEIYAMAGGSVLHAALAAAMLTELGMSLNGPCRTFTSNLRIRVSATGLTSYPDITIVCGQVETDPANEDTVVNPTAVVEVLSPSTIDYDLGGKFEHYQQIPSLQAVIYLWQDQRRIEVRQRAAGGGWQTRAAVAGMSVEVEPLDCVLNVEAIYVRAGA